MNQFSNSIKYLRKERKNIIMIFNNASVPHLENNIKKIILNNR